MKYEFGNMSTEVEKCIAVGEVFEKTYDTDEEQFYLSRKVFHHEEEDFSFDYKYAIKVTNVAMISGEDVPLQIELMLLVSPSSMNEIIRKKIADCMDWSDDLSEDWKYKDIADYSLAVVMGRAEAKDEEGLAYENNDELKHVLASITVLYETIDSLRGFYLDRAWNMIGTTGWDTLHECIDGTDSIRATLDRYKNE